MARVETAKSLENMVGSEKRRRTVENRFLELERMDVWGGGGKPGTRDEKHGNKSSTTW